MVDCEWWILSRYKWCREKFHIRKKKNAERSYTWMCSAYFEWETPLAVFASEIDSTRVQGDREAQRIGIKVWARDQWMSRLWGASHCHIWRWSSEDILSRPSTLLSFATIAQNPFLLMSRTLSLRFRFIRRRFRFHGIAIIGSKFAALERDEARDGHGRAELATRLRAWSRDIFKRTRLVLLAHHAGPRIVIRMRARAHTRHSLDAISTQ